MITKTFLKGDARKKIVKGVNEVYSALRLTLGVGGRNAMIPRTMNRGSRVTNDGYTISENIEPKDPHINQAANFFKEGSKKTNEKVGDGTTGTAVLGGHLYLESEKKIPNDNIPSAGKNSFDVMSMRRDMLDWKVKVLEEIKKRSKEIKNLKELEKIALISIEDERASKIVAKMIWELGVDNYVDVTEGYKGEIETEEIKGMRFPAKTAARAFVNKKERFEMIAEDSHVFVTNHKLDNPYDVVGIINNVKVSKLIIIAPDFSEQVLFSLIQTIKNGIFVYPVKCPALRTEQLEDLAVYTGATLCDKDKGNRLDKVTKDYLGFADRIVVKDTEVKEDAVLIGGRAAKRSPTLIKARQKMLKQQMNEAKNSISKEQLKRRIANMSSAVGIIRVGASTDAESLYLKLKIEDGVYACKAALQEGYVKGGGLCLKEIAEELPKNILTESLKAPYNQIQENAGGIKIGKDVIDPAKVVSLIVEHGVSIASHLITTDILTAEMPDVPNTGNDKIARAISHFVYFNAKEKGMLRDSEIEQEKDMATMFEQAMFDDVD